MRVLITDLLIAECDLSGKSGVECVRVQLGENEPEVTITPAELLKQLKLKKKMDTIRPH